VPALFFFVWLVVPTVVAIVYGTYLEQSTHQQRKKQLRARLVRRNVGTLMCWIGADDLGWGRLYLLPSMSSMMIPFPR